MTLPHPAVVAAVRSDRRKDWLKIIAAIQVAAKPVLANPSPKGN